MITHHAPIQPGGTTITWHCDLCVAEAHVKRIGHQPTGWASLVIRGQICPADHNQGDNNS